MKKIFYISLFLNAFVFGQENPNNRFSQSEHENENRAKKTNIPKNDVYGSPGNPGDTLPIDQYTGILLLIVLSIIIIMSRKSLQIK
jgi:hypothetical protein